MSANAILEDTFVEDEQDGYLSSQEAPPVAREQPKIKTTLVAKKDKGSTSRQGELDMEL